MVGAGKGNGGKPDNGGGRQSQPVVSLAASADMVPYGGDVLLSWASLDAKSCDASVDWSGSKPLNGTETISSLTADSRFVLTCKAGKSRVSESVTVTVDPTTAPVPAPRIVMSADPGTVDPMSDATITWQAENALICHAGMGWSGDKAVSGTEVVGPISQSSEFQLTCDGDGGSTTASVAIAVQEPAPDPAPMVTLDADNAVVTLNSDVVLTWNSLYANSCSAGGGWSGNKSLAGSETVGPITGAMTFSLVCANDSGTSYAAVSVSLADSGTVDLTSPGTIGDGRLDAVVATLQEKYDIPALGALVTRGGTIAEAAVSGMRYVGSTEPVTLEDQWHLGSLTKAITGTLIATQVEAGVIGWQTKVSEVWPNMSIRAEYRDVTLFDLMTHQSGLQKNPWDLPSISQVWDSAPGTVREKRLIITEDILNSAPVVSRGTYSYSNNGYVVAAAMVEAATDTDWEQLLTTHMLDPLGMVHTGFGAPGPNQPLGHRTLSDGSLEPLPYNSSSADIPKAIGPAFGMHTSFPDYSAFMMEHIAGSLGYDGLLSASTYDLLHTRHKDGYGIGWFVWTTGGETWNDAVLEHSGTNNKWRARVRLIPNLDTGVFVVTNAQSDAANEASSILRELLTERAKATP